MICTSADSKFPAFDQPIRAFLQQTRVAAVKNCSTFVLRQPSYSIVTLGQSKRKLKGVIGKWRKKKERKKERNEKDGIRTRQGFGELISGEKIRV